MKKKIYSSDEIRNKRTMLQIIIIFTMFCITIIAAGIVSSNIAANILRDQLATKCKSLALTVALIIEQDSYGYEDFLQTLDIESDYYKRTKKLMMDIKIVTKDLINFVYTEMRVDNEMMMYVIGGEDPSSPFYTAPGVKDKLVDANRMAYDRQSPITGMNFENTKYGVRLSSYVPIFHIDTGVFLGLVGADISRTQYNNVISVFIFETFFIIIIGIIFFGLALQLFFGSLRKTINTDTMTKLYNKAYFKLELKQRLKNSIENYVVMADLDHFKAVNDTYGHEFGDKVLVLIVEQLKKSTRGSDCVARYGGEEFVICFSDISREKVFEIMECIRSNVEKMEIFNKEINKNIAVTISLGGAKIPNGANLTEAVELADKALYTAKKKRNTCVLL